MLMLATGAEALARTVPQGPHEKAIWFAVRPPRRFAAAVGPSALTSGPDVELPEGTRALRVAGAGLQSVTMRDGSQADLLPLLAGDNPGEFASLRADAGNTATGVWAVVA